MWPVTLIDVMDPVAVDFYETALERIELFIKPLRASRQLVLGRPEVVSHSESPFPRDTVDRSVKARRTPTNENPTAGTELKTG